METSKTIKSESLKSQVLSIDELMDLRGKFVEANQISFNDFKRLLQLCDYSESEQEGAIEIRNNGEGQFIV